MGKATLTIRYEDVHGKTGTFGIVIDAAYDVAPYTELTNLVQAFKDSSQARVTSVQILKDLPDVETALLGNTASGAGAYDRIDDQAVLAFRSAEGLDVRMSIPAPADGLFEATGAYAQQDVSPISAELIAVLDAGITVPVLAPKVGTTPLDYRKGWRKGQKHS